MSAPRVLFYVQHLLGIGHLKRALTLGRALVHAGMDVTVVSGGDDVPVLDTTGLTFLQLPPVKAADRQFSAILGPDGEELDEALKSTRRDRLLEIFAEIDPTALIIELFPFGRRAMRFELLPLIDAARARQPRPLKSRPFEMFWSKKIAPNEMPKWSRPPTIYSTMFWYMGTRNSSRLTQHSRSHQS
jgi:predicted glycosyltransferase